MKIIYDRTLSCDCAVGGLRILYPAKDGFVEYTFVHSVVAEKNCDIWRMSVVNALDATFKFLHRLTKDHAEWEMALRLENRPDFIGGYNHGDEVGSSPVFLLDGAEIDPAELTEWREFSRLEIAVDSIGFDPACPEKPVLSHRKEYVYDADGVHLVQRVKWLADVVLDPKFKSFLAMMPPVKHVPKNPEMTLTDSFAFGTSPLQKIVKIPVEEKGVRSITVAGEESGYRFTMAAEGYAPLYPNSYLALLTDNGNSNYHKMYIAFAGGNSDVVSAGTTWHSVTHYRIEKM